MRYTSVDARSSLLFKMDRDSALIDTEICRYTLKRKKVVANETFLKHGKYSRTNLAMDLSQKRDNKSLLSRSAQRIIGKLTMISRKRVKRKSQLQKLFTVQKPRANHKERIKIEISIQSHRTWRLRCEQILVENIVQKLGLKGGC